jgi:hypothetical protein
VVRLGHLGQQRLGHLRPEAVGVMELHDATAGPRPVAARPGISFDEPYMVPVPG